MKEAEIFISHGGLNSINERLLLSKKPLIVVPQYGDQITNAAQIKLFEKINQEKITNNKELKLYFVNNKMSYDEIDIEKRDLEQLFKGKATNGNQNFGVRDIEVYEVESQE